MMNTKSAFYLIWFFSIRLSAASNAWFSNGPSGGIVTAIAPCRGTGMLYASTVTGGIYKTSDGGMNWSLTNKGLENIRADRGVLSLAVDPADCATVYAGTYADGIYKTIDGGATWLGTIADAFDVSAIVVGPDRTVYAGFSAQLARSTDGGMSWNQVRQGTIGRLSTDASGALYAVVGGSVLRSADGGLTWTDALSVNEVVLGLATSVTNAGMVIAATQHGVIYTSKDGGANWSSSSVSATVSASSAIAIDPADSSRAYVAIGNSLFTTMDGGLTWQNTGVDLPAEQITVLAFAGDGSNCLYAGMAGAGVFRTSDNARTWSEINGGINDVNVLHVDVDAADPTTVYTSSSGGSVWRSSDGTTTWQHAASGISSASAYAVVADPRNTLILFAATLDGVFKSTDGGGVWVLSSTGLLSRAVLAIAIDPASPDVVYAAAGILYRSVDAGTSWQPLLSSPPFVRGIAITSSPERRIYVASGYGVFLSSDDGQTWVQSLNGVFFSVGADPSNGRVYAQSRNILRSDDFGITWKDVTPAFKDSTVWSVALDPLSSNIVYIGTGTQGDGTAASYVRTQAVAGRGRANVWKSVNGGESWVAIGDGLSVAATVTSIAISRAQPTRLYAGTYGHGVFALQQALLRGDANGDNSVSVVDVFFLINYLFMNGPAPAFTSDANADGAVNVADVFFLLNYLFGSGSPPSPL